MVDFKKLSIPLVIVGIGLGVLGRLSFENNTQEFTFDPVRDHEFLVDVGTANYPGCSGDAAATVAFAMTEERLADMREALLTQCEQTADVLGEIALLSLELGDDDMFIATAKKVPDATAIKITDETIGELLSSVLTHDLGLLVQLDTSSPEFVEKHPEVLQIAIQAAELQPENQWTRSLLSMTQLIGGDFEASLATAEAAAAQFGEDSPFPRIVKELNEIREGTRTEMPIFVEGF